MEKIINIGDKEVKISNNVAWTMEYRDQFNKDVMESLMPVFTTLVEAVSTIVSEAGSEEISISDVAEAIQGRAFDITLPLIPLGFTDAGINVVWAMAKAADETIDPPKKWVRHFDTFPLDEIVPAIVEMIFTGFASSKNLERLRTMAKSLTQPKKKTKK